MILRLLFLLAGCVLAFALGAAERGPDSPPPAGVQRHWVTAGSASFQVEAPHGVRNRWVTIANDGTECVESPWVVANGRRDWFSTAEILAGILVPGMTEREKALAIWRFLVENRYHDAPAHEDIEMHDPVRFLNVYGYGFCDDSAVSFMVLGEKAGLQTRIWGLSGHVVPEAFFEGGWHMLDPDGEIFYLENDGRTIAGVKTLEQRPDLIHKYPSPYYKDSAKIAAIYTSAENNKLAEGYRRRSEAVHTMGFMLRPGESLTRHQENWGLYFTSYEKARPPRTAGKTRYGNGRFAFAPVFAGDVFRQGATEVTNLRVVRDGPREVLRSGKRPGMISYRFAGPYPYLAGTVTIQGRGKLALAFSEDGTQWTHFWTSSEGGRVDTRVPISDQLRTRVGRPVYAYHLRLSVEGEIESLQFESDVQVAPASLPVLQPGSNVIRYRDATSGTRRVRIEFAYDSKENR